MVSDKESPCPAMAEKYELLTLVFGRYTDVDVAGCHQIPPLRLVIPRRVYDPTEGSTKNVSGEATVGLTIFKNVIVSVKPELSTSFLIVAVVAVSPRDVSSKKSVSVVAGVPAGDHWDAVDHFPHAFALRCF